ncbi:MAG: HPr(Ser) kinase/phosphatase [Clostridia bacterium]|nr:HPr(Ser) kinase/phosphatase [Clostridia bacterium]
MIKADAFASHLHLTCLSPSTVTQWDINSADFNRPGMQFCGFYEYFAFERPQIIGKVEMTYLYSMEPEERAQMYKKYFSYAIPCVICCRNMRPPEDMLEAASRHNIAVYLTDQITTKFSFNCVQYLARVLAPRVNRHAVLVDVYGVGVLITGESGVGKSETALELIKRGHVLIADDVVEVCREADDILVGSCPEMIRDFMEIRGIGIIDIRAMYGISAVALRKKIDMVIHLEKWNESKEYVRLGMENDHIKILDVDLPLFLTPVRPGRNMAIIIEVAARNYSLKSIGYSAPHELDRRMRATPRD